VIRTAAGRGRPPMPVGVPTGPWWGHRDTADRSRNGVPIRSVEDMNNTQRIGWTILVPSTVALVLVLLLALLTRGHDASVALMGPGTFLALAWLPSVAVIIGLGFLAQGKWRLVPAVLAVAAFLQWGVGLLPDNGRDVSGSASHEVQVVATKAPAGDN